MRTLAWTLGVTGAVACALTLVWTIGLGLYSTQAVVLLMFVLTGLIGALIASRQPENGVGWLMVGASLVANLLFVPIDYGYTALVLHHGSWPLGVASLWFGAWAWSPLLGMFLPATLIRFPAGRVPARWRFVDWLAGLGTALWAFSILIAPADIVRGFLPLGDTGNALHVLALVQDPLGWTLPAATTGRVRIAGMALILLADVAAVASLVIRYRRAHGDERLQMKWIAYAGVLLAGAFVYAGVAWIVLGQPLGNALLPGDFATFTLPSAIGIAILRYRLYDIELIINRTVVYVSLTAILAAGYSAGVTFFQRLFISLSGQKSDAAYVLTAFAIVVGFSPLRDWLQHQVDRRIGRRRASAALDQFSAGIEAVISVMDVHRIACRFVDEAMAAFEARGAAVYLESTEPVYDRGRLNAVPSLEIPIRHDGRELGRLVLAERRGHIVYGERDRESLQRSADSVGEAVALAAHYGHQPFPSSRIIKEG